MRFLHRHSRCGSLVVIACATALAANLAATRIGGPHLRTADETWAHAWPADLTMTLNTETGRLGWTGAANELAKLVPLQLGSVRFSPDQSRPIVRNRELVITPTALLFPDTEPVLHKDNEPLSLAAAAVCDLNEAATHFRCDRESYERAFPELLVMLEIVGGAIATLLGAVVLVWPVALYVGGLSWLMARLAKAPFRAALAAMSYALLPAAALVGLVPVFGLAVVHLFVSMAALSAWVFPRASLEFVDEPPALWAAACDFVARQGVLRVFGARALIALVQHGFDAGKLANHAVDVTVVPCILYGLYGCVHRRAPLRRVAVAYVLVDTAMNLLERWVLSANPLVHVAVNGLGMYLVWAWSFVDASPPPEEDVGVEVGPGDDEQGLRRRRV